jgi:hypothetical protein
MLVIWVNNKVYAEVQGIHGLRGHIEQLGQGQNSTSLMFVVSDLLQDKTVTLNGKQIRVESEG